MINSFMNLYNIEHFKNQNLLILNQYYSNILKMQGFISHDNKEMFDNTKFWQNLSKSSYEMLERSTRYYDKPKFEIDQVLINEKPVQVTEKIILNKSFCNLIFFDKKIAQPNLLIVSPMAGHYATLLRETVRELLPFFNIYITDWINARDIPTSAGNFNMDDYIDYLIEFLEKIGKGTSLMAVCQPTVPALAATAIMSEQKHKFTPESLILIGGPVDARLNPTDVNDFATARSIDWFKSNVIFEVPNGYLGQGRKVYPGFIQLSGFMSMNIWKHIESHIKLFECLITGKIDKAEKIKNFYDEYLAVMDIPAEFYLQTIEEVFQKFSLATGKLISRGRKVNLKHITETALLGIEGENDDIAGVGQTKASLKLCKSLPDEKLRYHLQKNVGHYGVFSGSKFRDEIVPIIRDFIYKFDKD